MHNLCEVLYKLPAIAEKKSKCQAVLREPENSGIGRRLSTKVETLDSINIMRHNNYAVNRPMSLNNWFD